MKRFTETTKWQDPWFRKLDPRLKCLWFFLCDSCDLVGLFEVDWELASFVIGQKVTEADLKHFGDRIQQNGKKYLIKGFISFQYKELSSDCRAHRPVLDAIERQGLVKVGKDYQYPNDRVSTTTHRVSGTPDTHKEQEQDQEPEQVKGKQQPDLFPPEPTPEEIYQAYPLKVGKPEALKAIHKATAKRSASFLLERTQLFALIRGEDTSFLPHPATWFNQERYNDDPETWKRSEPPAPLPKRTATPGVSPTAELVLRQNELKRVEDRMSTLRNQYDSHQTWATEDAAEFKKLKTRRTELLAQLGLAV